jgi:hypothetical protein
MPTLSQRPGAPLYETLKLARNVAYRNTDHAIAELVDNSIDAGATCVQIMLIQQDYAHSSGRSTERVSEVIVADNGCGMSADVLDKAITISGSESSGQTGKIGRFGYGLIYSSIYTCNRLDIWSWQSEGFGISDSVHAYVDMKELENDSRSSHFYPSRCEPEDHIRSVLHDPSWGSGTIVRWKDFENFSWKKADTVIDKAEKVIGRLYRRHLSGYHCKNVEIFFTVAKRVNGECTIQLAQRLVRPNDPMYLIAPSNTPGFESECMFEKVKDPDVFQIDCPVEDVSGSIQINLSCVTRDNLYKSASDYREAGARPWGKHAFENSGISLLREGRELCLINSFYKAPQDRWWGIELEFTKELDNFFGVTSDKQQATRFQDCMAQYASLVDNRPALNEYISSMESQTETDARLIKLVHQLYECRKFLFDRVKSYRAGTRSDHTKDRTKSIMDDPEPLSLVDSAAAKASDARRRYMERFPQSNALDHDIATATPDELKRLSTELRNELIENPQSPDPEVIFKIDRLIALKRTFTFDSKRNEESKAFLIPKKFDLGVKICGFNKCHPFYTEILEALESLTESNGEALDLLTADEIKKNLIKATTGLYVVFTSWCELELESIGEMREKLQDVRSSWGVIAREFLESSGALETDTDHDIIE